MNIFRGSKLLDDLWDSSINMTDRDLSLFDGIYWVEMATGIIPQLPNWRKYISNTGIPSVDDNQITGYNVILKKGYGFPGKIFGDFRVRLYRYGLHTGLVLVYNNGFFKDYLKPIAPDLFLGKFYLVLRGREVFMGYFWLYATEPYRSGSYGKADVAYGYDAGYSTQDKSAGIVVGYEDINMMDDVEEVELTEIGTIAEIGEGEQIGDVLEDIPDEIVRKPKKAVELELAQDITIDEKEWIEADKAKEDDSLMDGWVEE